MGGISVYTAKNVEDIRDKEGLAAAQKRYRAWFIKTLIYARYKADADTILSTDGYGDCIAAA